LFGTWKKDLDLGPMREGLSTMASVSCCSLSILLSSESRREGSCCELGKLGGGEDFQILIIHVGTKFGFTIATGSLELPILLSRSY